MWCGKLLATPQTANIKQGQPAMKIESLHIKNFKAYKDARLDNLPAFCVIVGANGTGKSTLFDIFKFINDCLTYNVTKALQQRGGFKEVVSRGSTPDEHIKIELKYRITGKSPLVTYTLVIGFDQEKQKPFVEDERLKYKRGHRGKGKPFEFIQFSRGQGYAIKNEEDFNKPDEELEREYQTLEASDTLAIKGLGQFQRFKAASAFRQLIENWHLSDFHINAARGSKEALGTSDHLLVSGENLQLVAKNLHDNHPQIFQTIIEKMKQRVPGVSDITPRETLDGRLLLQFNSGDFKDPFIDKFVSDGTIKMFAYLVLLHDPQPHPFLCVEEPENQLYHGLLVELAEEFRDYAVRGGQVFVSTHSPDFLNAAKLEEVFWLEKQKGFTTIKRASGDAQIRAYMEEGDKMGYLWKQGFFGGVAPK